MLRIAYLSILLKDQHFQTCPLMKHIPPQRDLVVVQKISFLKLVKKIFISCRMKIILWFYLSLYLNFKKSNFNCYYKKNAENFFFLLPAVIVPMLTPSPTKKMTFLASFSFICLCKTC